MDHLNDINQKNDGSLFNLKLKTCLHCLQQKIPKTHHCKICDKCILNMDHHCTFLNNCIGLKNYKPFVLLLIYSFIIINIIIFKNYIFVKLALQGKFSYLYTYFIFSFILLFSSVGLVICVLLLFHLK